VRVIIAALMGVSLSATLALAEEPRIVHEGSAAAAERQKVQSAQVLLHILGLYDGSMNGTLGPATRKALTAYQEKVGLPASGLPDERTLFALAHPGCGGGPATADCLDRRAPSDANIEAPALAAMTNAAAARPAGDPDPCADPKLPLEQCLDAVAKIDGFMKARGVAKK
jgi:peptidoglycan hydrolase-like protein with peptidoglycan-binding domain